MIPAILSLFRRRSLHFRRMGRTDAQPGLSVATRTPRPGSGKLKIAACLGPLRAAAYARARSGGRPLDESAVGERGCVRQEELAHSDCRLGTVRLDHYAVIGSSIDDPPQEARCDFLLRARRSRIAGSLLGRSFRFAVSTAKGCRLGRTCSMLAP